MLVAEECGGGLGGQVDGWILSWREDYTLMKHKRSVQLINYFKVERPSCVCPVSDIWEDIDCKQRGNRMQGEYCYENDLNLYPVVLIIHSGPVCKMILVYIPLQAPLWKPANISYVNSNYPWGSGWSCYLSLHIRNKIWQNSSQKVLVKFNQNAHQHAY